MLTFDVVTDLKFFGHHWEDHSEIYGDVFLILAEGKSGRRWTHQVTFEGMEKVMADDGDGYPFPCWTNVREAAKAKAERLLARIETADGVIDMQYWHEIDPCYGSVAYQEADTEAATRAREREDHRFGIAA